MNRIAQHGYISGTLQFEDKRKIKPRPTVSECPVTQRRFIYMLRQIERLHNDSYVVVEGAQVTRSIGGGFTVRMDGETLKKNGKTAGNAEAVALWIWSKLSAKQEAA